MAIEIPDSAAFYVRSSFNRALIEARDVLRVSQEAIDNPEKCDKFTLSLAYDNKRHLGQWYKEAVKEFREFPESIQPDSDLLDFNPWKSKSQES